MASVCLYLCLPQVTQIDQLLVNWSTGQLVNWSSYVGYCFFLESVRCKQLSPLIPLAY